MASVVIADGVQPGVLTAVTLFTSSSNLGVGTRIEAFTATNQSASDSETYTVHIVPSGGSADATNKIIASNVLNPKGTSCGDVESPAEIINQIIPKGGTLQVLVSTITTISFRVSGRNL